MTLHSIPQKIHWGKKYVYMAGHRIEGRRGLFYVPTHYVVHCHTRQSLVHYEGQDGKDQGLAYVCPLVDWDLRFTLEETEAPAEPKKPPPDLNCQHIPTSLSPDFVPGKTEDNPDRIQGAQ